MATDYSARDDDAKVTFYVLLWKRNGISLEMFDDYWRDVHGPVCARLPGQFQYWQWHVAHNEGGIFPMVKGVNNRSTDEEQFDGIAELTFKSVQDRQTWMRASAILMDDEHNIFRKAIGYVTDEGNSKTYVDRVEVGDPNGRMGVARYHVMIRQADGVSVTDFRRYLTDVFAKAVARNDRVLKFRLHLFEPPDLTRPDAAGVAHAEPPEQLYQAAFEIGFRNHLDMETFFASADYAEATAQQAVYVKQMSPFPERDPYTFVYGGRMTVAGRRGSRTAELIAHIGAANQIRGDIADLLGIREPNA
jgi:EthD domain